MFKIPRGTRDFTPKEMVKRKNIENNIRKTFEKYGYEEIQTPTFESLELFTVKSGESIIDEIYNFTDKGGRELALRPELTAPVIRFYVEKLQMEPKPLKLFYFGNCYRYDRPQKGRYREFMQAGCELIGTDSCEAIAELISMSYYILKNVGLKDIILKIGNLNLIEAIFDKLEISKDDRKDLLPLIDKSEFEETCKYLEKIGISKEKIDIFIEIIKKSDIDIISNFLKDDEESIKEISKMEKLFDLIFNCFSIKECEMDISIVRGLDYYNGIVFEINAPKLGAEKQLCGGGIYELVKLFGGREIPTSGFAIGFDRTILALEIDNYKFIEKQIDVFVVPINDETLKKSIEIVQMLRNNSFSAEFDLQKRGVGKALKYANFKNAKKVIIIGPDELKDNSVTIRDMKSGNQELVKISDILSKLK